MSAVRLRAITEDDLADYVRWSADPEVAQHLGRDTGSLTMEHERDWFVRISAPECRERHWALEVEGRHIGGCALMPHPTQQKADFGLMIGDKTAWGKGYGTAALQEVLRIGFTEMNLHRIALDVLPDNARGLRCYEKCGFRREGYARQMHCKDGRWRDVVHMAILREEWVAACGGERVESRELRVENGLRIRHYRSCDHTQVLALWEAVMFSPNGPNEEATNIARKLATQPGFFLVAEMDGQIVGSTVGSLERGWGWIQKVAVHPDYQRRGIATQLVRRAEAEHAKLGAFRTVLLTRDDNTAGRALYEQLGYNVWEHVIVMGRKFPAAEEESRGN